MSSDVCTAIPSDRMQAQCALQAWSRFDRPAHSPVSERSMPAVPPGPTVSVVPTVSAVPTHMYKCMCTCTHTLTYAERERDRE